MKFYITKYATTKGIIEIEGEYCNINSMIKQDGKSIYFHCPFHYELKKDAIIHANSIIKRKIESLKKQITRLEKLDIK